MEPLRRLVFAVVAAGGVVSAGTVQPAAQPHPAGLTIGLNQSPFQPTVQSSLHDLLARVAAYIRRTTPEWANLVAEETYVQERATTPSLARRLSSDALLVAAGRAELMFFRDVRAVDGRAVPDGTTRLEQLFITPAGDAADIARRVAGDSERFHLAGGSFLVTNPWKVIAVMQDRFQARLRFELGDEVPDLAPGVRELRFTEPPMPGSERNLREPSGGSPLFGDEGARGRIWVEVTSGTVLRTSFSPGEDGSSTSAVTFARDARLGVLVPASMATTWMDPATQRPVSGRATYRNYRRFDVTTHTSLPEAR